MKTTSSGVLASAYSCITSALLLLVACGSNASAQVLKFPSDRQVMQRYVQRDTVVVTRVDTIRNSDGTIRSVATRQIVDSVGGRELERFDPKWDTTRVIAQGQLSYRDSRPVVGLNILELFVSPDLDGWNLTIPIVVSSSSVIAESRDQLNRVASSLLDAAAGVLNVTATNHKEFRQRRADGSLSLTGVYLDYGLVIKGDIVSDANNRSSLYVTAGPHARVDLRVTTSRTRTPGDYTGLIHLRLGFTGNLLVERPAAFDQFDSVKDLSRSGAFEVALGFFPVNSASVNLVKFTTGIGNLPQEFRGRWSTGVSLFAR